eukprot:6453085-Heterocapsa_arctica.AAC.1
MVLNKWTKSASTVVQECSKGGRIVFQEMARKWSTRDTHVVQKGSNGVPKVHGSVPIVVQTIVLQHF